MLSSKHLLSVDFGERERRDIANGDGRHRCMMQLRGNGI